MGEKTGIKNSFVYFSFLNVAGAYDDVQVFGYIYDKMTAVARANGFRVEWGISPLLAKKLSKDAPVGKAYARIHWKKSELRRLLKRAGLVVADTVGEAMAALSLGRETLLMYGEAIPDDYKEAINGAFVSDGFEGILQELQKRSGGKCEIPFLFDCPAGIEGNRQPETVIYDTDIATEEKKMNRDMLLLWEQCNNNRDKILRLRNSRKYDELSLLFDSLKQIIRKYPEKKTLPGWDCDIFSVFAEVQEKQGEA